MGGGGGEASPLHPPVDETLMGSQHRRLSWIYWPATVQGSVNFQGVNVWQMGSSVLICADCENQASTLNNEESADEQDDEMEDDEY